MPDNPQGPVRSGDKLTHPEPHWTHIPKQAMQKLRNEATQRQFDKPHSLRTGAIGVTPEYPIYQVGDEYYVDLRPNGRPRSYNETVAQMRIQEVVRFSGPGSYIWDHASDVMQLWDGFQWVRVDRQIVSELGIIPRDGSLNTEEYNAILAEVETRNAEADRVALRQRLAEEQGHD